MRRAPTDSGDDARYRDQVTASLVPAAEATLSLAAGGVHLRMTVVPWFGAEWISASPPASCIRATIEPDTPCRPIGVAFGSKPRPSSLTSMVRLAASLVSVTVRLIEEPSSPACRSELRTASSVASVIACATSAGISPSLVAPTTVRMLPAIASTRLAMSFSSAPAATGTDGAVSRLSESSAWRALARRAARSGRPFATAIRAERMWSWMKLLARRWAWERARSAASTTACARYRALPLSSTPACRSTHANTPTLARFVARSSETSLIDIGCTWPAEVACIIKSSGAKANM